MDLNEALTVMDTPVWVPGRSDADLVTEVQAELGALTAAAAAQGNRLPVKPISPAQGVGAGLLLRPIDALLRLSRATMPLISDDLYDWYKHWSWLRYLGTFDLKPTGRLGLSETGLKVHGNQRRVLSEDLGVGFGVLVAEHWCRHLGAVGPITAVDVDLAINEGRRWVPVHGGNVTVGPRQPDYLLVYPDPTGGRGFTVKTVECKGSSTVGKVPGQLARAATQLASLELSGVTPQGIAVDTVSNRRGVFYWAIDPADDRESDSVIITERDLRKAREPARLSRSQEGVLSLPAGEFVAASLLVGAGALADYAGNLSASADLLPPVTRQRLRRERRSRTVQETEDGRFIGVEHLLPTPGGTLLRVFSGVAEEVDTALNSGRLDEIRAAQAGFQEGRPAPAEQDADNRLSQGDGAVSAAGADGAVLILRS